MLNRGSYRLSYRSFGYSCGGVCTLNFHFVIYLDFLSCSCSSDYGWPFFFIFLPNLFCISEVSDDIHQDITACTSFVFFSGPHIFTRGSIFFLSVRFFSLRFGASNEFVSLNDCFGLARANTRLWLFLLRVFFFFCASFTYLEHLYLRYVSYAVFIYACFHLRYHSVLSCMRFSQFLHLMR